MANEEIRKHARVKSVPFWKVAYTLGISEPTMTRKLRFELSPDEKRRVMQTIDKLSEKQP